MAIQTGLTIEQIDNYTFNETRLIIEVYNEKILNDADNNLNMAIVNAYYTEVFKRQDRAKRLPKLDKFLVNRNKNKKTKVKDNSEEMLEKVKALNTLFGGELIVKEGGCNNG